MFDLSQAIVEWRRQMLASGIKAPVPMDELENHLREEIECQMKSGLNEQKAFDLAVGRMGQAHPLKLEFEKVISVDNARQRKRAGILFAAMLVFYSLMMSRAIFKNDLTFNERLSGFASLAAMLASVFAVWQILPRCFPVIASKTVQSAVGIIGGISGMSWFLAFVYFILPRCNFTQGQLLVAVLWAIIPVMAFPTTAFLVIEKSEREQFKTNRS